MKVSQLYGKIIESANKKKCGYILGISHTSDTIDGYICCNESENEFFADSTSARFIGDKAIVLKTDKAVKRGARLKLGHAVYSEDGKFLGHVDDYTVKGNKILYAHIGKRKLDFGRLILGDVAILKSAHAQAEVAAKDMFISALCNN